MKLLAAAMFFLSQGVLWGQQPMPMPLDRLLTEAELRQYQAKPRYKDRMKVLRFALQRFEGHLLRYAKDREHAAVRGTLKSLSDLGCYGRNEPSRERASKELRSKKVKKLEIEIRKALDIVQDVKFDFPTESHPAFDEALRSLTLWRRQLLSGMFGQEIRTREDIGKPLSLAQAFAGSGWTWAAQQRRRRRSGPIGDQFTEAELDKIRLNQGLKERVEVFLEIAESRLDEIHRRATGEEWAPPGKASEKDDKKKGKKKSKKKKKKPEKEPQEPPENPLQFFTVNDMVHAYQRAIDGITINVDDRFEHGAVDRKELKKVLKKVNSQVQDFLPRLATVKEAAVEQKDEELYRTVLRAEKISKVALMGSQAFLGAPEK